MGTNLCFVFFDTNCANCLVISSFDILPKLSILSKSFELAGIQTKVGPLPKKLEVA